jgi:hypothetical protein
MYIKDNKWRKIMKLPSIKKCNNCLYLKSLDCDVCPNIKFNKKDRVRFLKWEQEFKKEIGEIINDKNK